MHEDYGNISEFKKFLKEAHRRNLKVIIELVINHTSDQHPWFKRAIRSAKESVERNYYVWSDDPSKYKDVRIIFQDYETSNWSWNEEAQQYYWHRFFHHQPDLNYDNPDVQQEIFKIIDYWCKMGVDGFRLDAVPYLYEREGTNGENLPETHLFLKELRAYIDKYYPGTLLLAEANMWPEDAVSYFGKGDECHMNYHFPLMPRMFMAIEMEDKHPIIDIFDQTPPIPATCQWAIFLRNHDELTLEMVTDEERDYMYKMYARDPKARINLGIRHRLAPLLENDRRKIELMNALLFSMPGTPVIYYGDEIGMGDNFYLGDRNGVRTPMQWSPDRNAGFSAANPQHLYLPVILDPAYHYEAVNVETQKLNTSSLFWYMKRIIAARKKYQVFGRGDLKFLYTDNTKILAYTRTLEEETILVVTNLSKFSQPVGIDLHEHAGKIPVELFSKNPFPLIKEGISYTLTLGPHSFYWFLLPAKSLAKDTKAVNPVLKLESWEDLLHSHAMETFENIIIPNYLKKASWYSKQEKTILNCSVRNHISAVISGRCYFYLFIDVMYRSGFPDTIQLPVIFLRDDIAASITNTHQEAAIARMILDGHQGILMDGFYVEEFQRWLLNKFSPGNNFKDEDKSLVWNSRYSVTETKQVSHDIINIPHEQATFIKYGGDLLLKIFRRIEPGLHPGIEIANYLTNEGGYRYTPLSLGSIEWKTKRETYILAHLLHTDAKQLTGYEYMLERIDNYIERLLALKDSHKLMHTFPKELVALPVFESLDPALATLLGSRAASEFSLIGKRIAEAHIALSKTDEKMFTPERFSLHYQHSLYSSIRGLVRRSFASIERKKKIVSSHYDIELLLPRKNEIIKLLQRINNKKMDAQKIRIHGNFDLHHISLQDKDIQITNFGGNPIRYLSERRLKRSPLLDIASFVYSIFDTAHRGFLANALLHGKESKNMMRYADIWAFYMSGFFINSYLDTMAGNPVIPTNKKQSGVMLETYLLEVIFSVLPQALERGSDDLTTPVRLLDLILNKAEPS